MCGPGSPAGLPGKERVKLMKLRLFTHGNYNPLFLASRLFKVKVFSGVSVHFEKIS